MAKCFIISETRCVPEGLQEMLDAIGATNWQSDKTVSGGEYLVEVCGRICYKSFGTDLNKNLTKVREGNREYIGNILRSRHGSVIEHATSTVGIIGCSRIFTHELVRHRAGVAISQESQRFVRLDDFDVYIPDLDEPLRKLAEIKYKDNPPKWGLSAEVATWAKIYVDMIGEISGEVKDRLAEFIDIIQLDAPEVPFDVKKQITSALRRFIPGGVNTSIICTANHRAWRHMIAMRTSPGAEIEIRDVFYDIAVMFWDRYKNFYQDMSRDPTTLVCTFEHDKI